MNNTDKNMDEYYGYLEKGSKDYVDKYDQYMEVEFEYCCRTFIQYDRYPFRMEFCNPNVNWEFGEGECDRVARPGFYKEKGFGDPENHEEYFRASVAHVCCHHMQQKRCKGDYLECISDDYTYTG